MADNDEKEVKNIDVKEAEVNKTVDSKKVKNEKATETKNVKEKGKKRNILARFISVIVVLAIVIGIIFVALPSPARALEEMFRDLKAGKIEDVSKYVDYKELSNIPALENTDNSNEENTVDENEKLLFEDLQWNIKKIEKNDDEAKIEVEITNKNYKNVFQNFTKKVVQMVLNNENPSDEKTEQYLIEELKNKDVGQLTSTQEITVKKQDGSWKVLVDDNLKNGIFPGLSEALSGFSD